MICVITSLSSFVLLRGTGALHSSQEIYLHPSDDEKSPPMRLLAATLNIENKITQYRLQYNIYLITTLWQNSNIENLMQIYLLSDLVQISVRPSNEKPI